MTISTEVLPAIIIWIIASSTFGYEIQNSFVRVCRVDNNVPFSVIACIGIVGNANHIVVRYNCIAADRTEKYLMVGSTHMDCHNGRRIDFTQDSITHILPENPPLNYNQLEGGYAVIKVDPDELKDIKPITVASQGNQNETCSTFCSVKMIPNVKEMQDPKWTINLWESDLSNIIEFVNKIKAMHAVTCHSNVMSKFMVELKACFLGKRSYFNQYAGCFEVERGISPSSIAGSPVVCGDDTVYGFVNELDFFEVENSNILPFEWVYPELVHFLTRHY